MSSYFTFASESYSILLVRSVYAAALCAALAVLYFALLFPYGDHQKKYFITFALLAIAGVAISFSPLVVTSVQLANGQSTFIEFGGLYRWYALCLFLILLSIFVVLISRWAQVEDSRTRRYFQFFTLGVSIPVIFGGFTNLYLPYSYLGFGDPGYVFLSIQNFGPASTMFLSGITAYSILRHKLMNMRVILRRNTLSFLAGVVAFCVIVVLVVVQEGFAEIHGNAFLVLVGIALLVVAFFALQYVFSHLFKVVFKRELYDFRDWTKEEVERMKKSVDLNQFCRDGVADFQRKLPVESLTLVIYDHPSRSFVMMYPLSGKKRFRIDEPWLVALRDHPQLYARDRVDAGVAVQKSLAKQFRDFGAMYVAPLKPYERLVGAVLVGQRIDHKEFTQENEQFITDFASSTGETLWNILQIQHYVYEGLSEL